MRSVIFDVETTGLEPERGHKIIEIAAIELIDDLPTGDAFHVYVDPMRDIPADASRIHGITMETLEREAAQPFVMVADDLLAYLGDSLLIAHNAKFDIGFLDFEFHNAGFGRPLPYMNGGRVADTLEMAREKFGVGGHTLDALCRRFGIDTSMRKQHSALLDCQLLAQVYLGLLGGRQRGLEIPAAPQGAPTVVYAAQTPRQPRHMRVSPLEAMLHAEFIKKLFGKPMWGSFKQ